MMMITFIARAIPGIVPQDGGGDHVFHYILDMIGVIEIGGTTLRTTAIGTTRIMATIPMVTTRTIIGATRHTYLCITGIMDTTVGMVIHITEIYREIHLTEDR